jgi:hypothetical protein
MGASVCGVQYNLERYGRRPMLLTSIVGVTAGLMLLAMNFTIVMKLSIFPECSLNAH